MREEFEVFFYLILAILALIVGLVISAMIAAPIVHYVIRPYFEWCCS